ncbi:GDSL-type esterase/lipase family protein [Psychrobacillus sp. FSL H8-0484]|uniref:GDSL-type esterase/lipase family protein n=1 Tax=Psychrobacillus sp. FSL H8-0484 TaxID=2921390 RepID=UPI0030F6B21A
MMKVVCFGDSITARKEGYPSPILTSKLSAEMTGYQFINAGISGNTTEQAKERFTTDVLNRNPDIVTILFGANDSATHRLVDLETFKQNLYEFTKRIGPAKTILITPAPVDEVLQPNRSNERIKKYAQAVEEVASETGSHLIDFFTEIYSKPDYTTFLKGEKDDGLHFGETGYAILTSLIVYKIEEINSIPKKRGFFERLLRVFFTD